MPEITSIPSTSDPRWVDIVTGKKTKNWEMLAAKIMMSRVVSSATNNPSPDNLKKCIEEVHSFFEKNIKLAQNDLSGLF